MMSAGIHLRTIWKPVMIAAAFAFLYTNVLSKLVGDWWSNDNYSYGLIIPFVFAYTVWTISDDLRITGAKPQLVVGAAVVVLSLGLLLLGTLGAELFIQRISLVFALAGVVIYFFGTRIASALSTPFLLLFLSIPIPQIVFNKITFPLQLFASRVAGWAIGWIGIPSVRRGNVIEVTPLGGVESVALGVVEACSGIRSLMALVTLAVLLGYFTRERNSESGRWSGLLKRSDIWRIAILVVSAVPIALLTNSARVTGTVIATYYYGRQAAEGVVHEFAGGVVFAFALAIMIGLNFLLKRLVPESEAQGQREVEPLHSGYTGKATAVLVVGMFIFLLSGGVLINWLENRERVELQRRPLSEFTRTFDIWSRVGSDFRFDAETERVLKADDYVMRNYASDDSWINLYVGYYGLQQSGATYHSPLNCLPGAGWELEEAGSVTINTPSGRSFKANRYHVRNGNERHILIYWYQGRGRTTASEYRDKFYTIWDSITERRSDGALVRVMTPLGGDAVRSENDIADFAGAVSDRLEPFVPR